MIFEKIHFDKEGLCFNLKFLFLYLILGLSSQMWLIIHDYFCIASSLSFRDLFLYLLYLNENNLFLVNVPTTKLFILRFVAI